MICICGKPCLEGKPWCSERCKYVVDGLSTVFGQYMSVEHAYEFFGTQYDKRRDG